MKLLILLNATTQVNFLGQLHCVEIFRQICLSLGNRVKCENQFFCIRLLYALPESSQSTIQQRLTAKIALGSGVGVSFWMSIV